jgi:hypothetical protein
MLSKKSRSIVASVHVFCVACCVSNVARTELRVIVSMSS